MAIHPTERTPVLERTSAEEEGAFRSGAHHEDEEYTHSTSDPVTVALTHIN